MTQPVLHQSALDAMQAIHSGSTCAVLVEGGERGGDAQILQIIMKSAAQSITFYGRDGRDNIIKELSHFVASLPTDKVVAIVDRDFTDEAEVEKTYAPDYAGHLFYWRRYCIENYLLEPELIAGCLQMTHHLNPQAIPQSLATAEAAERFLLDWSRKLAPQIAGNWVIRELTVESDRQNLNIEAPPYFKDITDRDQTWVLSQLTRTYAGWQATYPALFGLNALQERFDEKLKLIAENVGTLSTAHKVVDGKRFLKPVLLREIPASLKGYFFSLLANEASNHPPEDIRTLVEDRILPRWRKARAASQP